MKRQQEKQNVKRNDMMSTEENLALSPEKRIRSSEAIEMYHSAVNDTPKTFTELVPALPADQTPVYQSPASQVQTPVSVSQLARPFESNETPTLPSSSHESPTSASQNASKQQPRVVDKPAPSGSLSVKGLPGPKKEAMHPIDTCDLFAQVMKNRWQFESWEDFILPFEEFQRQSRTIFKARNACRVSYVNSQKGRKHKIPDKFLYIKVHMICVHYGAPKVVEAADRRRSDHLALHCNAYVKLSFKRDHLAITDLNLIHQNHSLVPRAQVESLIRKIRPIEFTDELDLHILHKVEAHEVFAYSNRPEARWLSCLTDLQEVEGLEDLTSRMLKKRIGVLMDNFKSKYSEGYVPVEDVKGLVLQRIVHSKEAAGKEPKEVRKKRNLEYNVKSTSAYQKKIMKKRMAEKGKWKVQYNDKTLTRTLFGSAKNIKKETEFGDEDNFDDYDDDSAGTSSGRKKLKMEDSQKLWQKEIDLAREEMAIRKKELELQKEKLKFEQEERMKMLELLKQKPELLKDGIMFVEDPVRNKELDASVRATSLATQYGLLLEGFLEAQRKSNAKEDS